MLHCTTTHQRLSVRWAKGSKPRWEQSLCPPEHRGLPHSLSCQTEGRKRRNTSQKISTGSVIYDDLCRAPRLPLTTLAQWFPSSSLSFLPVFHSTFCLFSVCVPFCRARSAPAHPRQHPAATFLLLPRTRARISKTAVCQLLRLQVTRFRSSVCEKVRVKRKCLPAVFCSGVNKVSQKYNRLFYIQK